MTDIDFPFTQSYSGACPKCRFVLPPLEQAASIYFEKGHVSCSNCSSDVDLWDATLEKVIRLAVSTFSLAALGPRITHLRFRLLANQTFELDLTKYGIAQGATILTVNYTPQGGNCLPLETHGNTPRRRFIGTKTYLFGVQMRASDGTPIEDESSGENISAMVLWAPVEDSEIPWLYLVDAIDALTLGRVAQAIMLAHSTAEISITPAAHSFLVGYSSRESVDRLLKQEAGFSSILNVVLPLICKIVGAKPIPQKVLNGLNKLRKRRNQVLHEGVTPSGIDTTDVREMLCAAAFALEYAKYLHAFHSGRRSA